MTVLVVDYGMGNLGSVRRSLEECGAEVNISDNPTDLATAAQIVLPGVGAFNDGMRHLRQKGWIQPLRNTVLKERVPLLGICLGMQLLADASEESSPTLDPHQLDAEPGRAVNDEAGLGLIPGRVVRFNPTDANERVPHVGWNEMHQGSTHPLFDQIDDLSDFYFVHSYHFVPESPGHCLATTPYCGHFCSVVGDGAVHGTQFHPEKSSRAGFQLLRNFLAL